MQPSPPWHDVTPSCVGQPTHEALWEPLGSPQDPVQSILGSPEANGALISMLQKSQLSAEGAQALLACSLASSPREVRGAHSSSYWPDLPASKPATTGLCSVTGGLCRANQGGASLDGFVQTQEAWWPDEPGRAGW